MRTKATRGATEDTGRTSTRRGRTPKRKEQEYIVRIRPKVEALLGNVEELLFATTGQHQGDAGQEQQDAPCPAVVALLLRGQEEYAKALVGGEVRTREQARSAFEGIQWLADRRKTKADTEERALQEKLTGIFRSLKEMILVDGDEEEWKRRAWNFGDALKDLIWLLENVDTRIDVANFPRALYQGSIEPSRHRPPG